MTLTTAFVLGLLIGLVSGWISLAGALTLMVFWIVRRGRNAQEKLDAQLAEVRRKGEEIASKAGLAAAKTKGEN